MSIEVLLPAILAIFLVAGMVKGVLGFGLPIITMSLLPFVIPVEQAIVLSAIVQPFTNIFQLVSTGGYQRAIQVAWPVIATLVPGVAIGAWYLTSLDGRALLMIVGVTISAFALINLLGYRIAIRPERRVPAGLGFGLIAGIFGALTSLNGWAFILYLVGLDTPRDVFRGSIALLFLVSGTLISSSFWIVGLLDGKLALIGGAALATAFPGMWIGERIGRRIPADTFRKLLLVSLILIGTAMVIRAYLAGT